MSRGPLLRLSRRSNRTLAERKLIVANEQNLFQRRSSHGLCPSSSPLIHTSSIIPDWYPLLATVLISGRLFLPSLSSYDDADLPRRLLPNLANSVPRQRYPRRLICLIVATGGGGQTGLDILGFSNIATPKARYFAPLFVGWAFLGIPPSSKFVNSSLHSMVLDSRIVTLQKDSPGIPPSSRNR